MEASDDSNHRIKMIDTTFIAYTEEMDGVFAQHDVSHHCFADDTHAGVHTRFSIKGV